MKKLLYFLVSLAGIVAVIAFLHFHSRPPRTGYAPPLAGRFDARPLVEVSGMTKSRGYPNTYWVVNDSGADPRLFAVNNAGQTIIPTFSRFSYYGEEREDGKEQWPGFRVLYAENVDWESMTIDANYLYIADTGNNFNNRRDLGIYMISEIDPTASTQSAVIRHLPVHYPEQTGYPGSGPRHFDSEALFAADGSLYLVTKNRAPGGFEFEPGANLYRLSPPYSDEANPLVLVDSHPELLAVTGAELSPDGSRLAVLSYTDLWLFDRPQDGDRWLSSVARRYPLDTEVLRQAETVAWEDDDTLLVSNEQRDLFRIDLLDLGEPAR